MQIISPKASDAFVISEEPAWPSLVFETDGSGAHHWTWTLKWGAFSKSGQHVAQVNTWDASSIIRNLGRDLSVLVKVGNASASISLKITGKNPTEQQVTSYLASNPANDGFEKIIAHESKFKHFKDGQPVKSFDNGYGMCQLTTPQPSFEQVWNWQRNIDGGLALFAQKCASAKKYLSQSGRIYTSDQLKRETVCRWNGGRYHEWDAGSATWVRNASILCDSATGNIGWDLNDAANQNKTEAELHARDARSYAAPPGPDAHWKYLGVCYADRILG